MSSRGDFGVELRDLRKDLERLRGNATALLRAFVDAGRDEAGHAGDRFRHGVEGWLDELRADLRDARSRGDSRLTGLTDFVSSKPLVGVALGVGVGIALANLLRRRPS
jgi:ElaB/YqjD/DUF883 family membrane-anchored ribosome-binding protein